MLFGLFGKKEKSVEAGSNKDEPQAFIVYLCQKCAALTAYLATPCTDCGFLPTSTEEIRLGLFLSTYTMRYSTIATTGGWLRDGMPITKITDDFEDRFAKFKSDPNTDQLLSAIQMLRTEPSIKRAIDNFTPIIAKGKCNTCGKETPFFSSHIFCHHCRSFDVYVPELMKYKKCLVDVLLWLEAVCAPIEHPDFALFMYKLALYKADAIETGHVMTKEQGLEVRQALINIQKFPSHDGHLILTVLGDSITVEEILNRQPTQQETKTALFKLGVALFENFFLYCNNDPKLEGKKVIDRSFLEKASDVAGQGDAEAKYTLGVMYGKGHGVTLDYAQAVHWLTKAAEAGHAEGQYTLGLHYAEGCGVTRDDAQAVHWFTKAAEAGHAEGQYSLGVMYGKGHGVTLDYAQAVHWLTKAAEAGHAEGQYALGLKYVGGRGVTRDDAQAVHWYTKAAEAGHAGAQWMLGLMYADGRGVMQDDVQAAHWLTKAAEAGHAGGQYALGVKYVGGCGVTRDDAQAAHWFTKAAEAGHAEGQYSLGVMYAEGRGVTRDDVQAVRWLTKAAEAEHTYGQYQLGYMYVNGRGVTRDDAQAVHWFMKAAEAGDADGQYMLGFMYKTGRGVTRDDVQAVHWYTKAAEAGQVEGQYQLGYMYAQGRGAVSFRIDVA